MIFCTVGCSIPDEKLVRQQFRGHGLRSTKYILHPLHESITHATLQHCNIDTGQGSDYLLSFVFHCLEFCIFLVVVFFLLSMLTLFSKIFQKCRIRIFKLLRECTQFGYIVHPKASLMSNSTVTVQLHPLLSLGTSIHPI